MTTEALIKSADEEMTRETPTTESTPPHELTAQPAECAPPTRTTSPPVIQIDT